MVYTIAQIGSIIEPIVKKYNISHIYLFGSYARGEATDESDIDFLVDTSGTHLKSLISLGALYTELEEALNKPIDLVTISTLEQEPTMESDMDFREAVMKERVSLYASA